MARKQLISHPDDETLLALVDGDSPLDPATRSHVATCPRCSNRVTELRATRRLLQAVATERIAPPKDIARRAVSRLRIRETAIGNMNEVFAAVRALLRGVAGFFGNPSQDVRSGPAPSDPEVPHG